MKKVLSVLFSLLLLSCASRNVSTLNNTFSGKFADDYQSTHYITDSLWVQHNKVFYHIIKWDTQKQFILALNGEGHGKNKGKYTRIDYTVLKDMEPWQWGFCLTVYDAENKSQALTAPEANRNSPKNGCNGYPFTRMKQSP